MALSNIHGRYDEHVARISLLDVGNQSIRFSGSIGLDEGGAEADIAMGAVLVSVITEARAAHFVFAIAGPASEDSAGAG